MSRTPSRTQRTPRRPAARAAAKPRSKRDEWMDWATSTGRIAAASRSAWAAAYDRNAGSVVRQLRALPAATAMPTSEAPAPSAPPSAEARWRAGEISLLGRANGSLFGGGS